MAPHPGFWSALAREAASFCEDTTPPCSKILAGPADRAAYTRVATTAAMVVVRAVARAVKRPAKALIYHAYHMSPLTDTALEAAETRGVQAGAASEVAAALSAASCTVQDSDWPPAVPTRTRNHV